MTRLQLHDGTRGTGDAFHEDLDVAACRLASADSRVDDARVVEDEEVAGLQQRGQIGEAQVGEIQPGNVKQPAARARGRGRLRDQLGRQRIVEIRQRVRVRHGGRERVSFDYVSK